MITIKFSTVKDPASDAPQVEDGDGQQAQDDDSKPRLPLAWIPATLGVGLLIAALYLKGRIWTPHPHIEPNPARVIMPPAVQPLPPPEAPKKPTPAESVSGAQPGRPQ